MRYLFFLGLVTQSAMAYTPEVIYYDNHAREVVLNANSQTLMVFPAPPVGYNCHPKAVKLQPLQSLNEASAYLGGTGRDEYLDRLRGNQQSKQEEANNELVDSMLLLTPFRRVSTTCAVKLSNGDTVAFNAKLSSETIRPAVEFRNVVERSDKLSSYIQDIGYLEFFKNFVSSKKINLINITPKKLEKYTKSTYYKVSYLGTDKKSIRAWKVYFYARKNMTKYHFKPKSFGDVLFVSWPKKSFKKTEKNYLYVLTSHDITHSEFMEYLK